MKYPRAAVMFCSAMGTVYLFHRQSWHKPGKRAAAPRLQQSFWQGSLLPAILVPRLSSGTDSVLALPCTLSNTTSSACTAKYAFLKHQISWRLTILIIWRWHTDHSRDVMVYSYPVSLVMRHCFRIHIKCSFHWILHICGLNKFSTTGHMVLTYNKMLTFLTGFSERIPF